MQVSAYLIR